MPNSEIYASQPIEKLRSQLEDLNQNNGLCEGRVDE